ncbi:MAG TPA: hypothetical protein VGI95_03685 [Caulobacteraceae bacterium]|jgi:hypothetical protein
MNYIHQPGDPQARPPYTAQNVLMQGGFLKADTASLQKLVDLVLNQVDPDVRFTVATDRVLFAGLYEAKMRSADPQDAKFGYVIESDIGLWIATWGGRKGEAPGLRWMPAFVFVDSVTALMTGRELYGYPKQQGRMIRNAVGDPDFTVDLKVICFAAPGPNQPAQSLTLLEVQRMAGGAPASVELSALADYIRGPVIAGAPASNAPDAAKALGGLVPPFLGMPMVFLRQMRDVASLDAAQVQEIATVTVQPTHTAGGGPAPAHHVTFPDVASFPIASTLGCASDVDFEAPFWLRMDFKVGVGQRI